MKRALPIAASWLLLFVGGCDEQVVDQRQAATPAATGTGVIRGQVRLKGTPPIMAAIVSAPCHGGAEGSVQITDETVLVADDGGLQNVIVYLSGLPATDCSGLPAAKLDQVNCRFVPHVLAVGVGQPLVVTSSDPTFHNVHWQASANSSENFALTSPGARKSLKFARAEMIPVRCDVHPWMRATIRVFDHPHFDVSKPDGRFELTKLPPGKYTLAAWHELYGSVEQMVDVTSAAPVTVDLAFRVPG
ncbi:MAG: carboxypeptidase regulatory-like domain-containing protein [Tepidisphaeraceae bacterium]